MRGSNKEKCICCGQLKCHTHKQNEENDLVHLVLELLCLKGIYSLNQ